MKTTQEFLTFGEALRFYREHCSDAELHKSNLSQPRLAELLANALDIDGLTGATISNWERNARHIPVHERETLLALIKVLHINDGLPDSQAANTLLNLGGYSALTAKELATLFPGATQTSPSPETPSTSPPKTPTPTAQTNITGNVTGPVFSGNFYGPVHLAMPVAEPMASTNVAPPTPGDVWQKVVVFLEKVWGPNPSVRRWLKVIRTPEGAHDWPQLLIALLTWPVQGFGPEQAGVLVGWVAAVLFTIWGVLPSLHWPLSDAIWPLVWLALSALGLPALVAALALYSGQNWRQANGLELDRALVAYAYQGAGIGFFLGYMGAVGGALFAHYLGFKFGVVGDALTIGVILGTSFLSSRLVPDNLWKAYKRLDLADGAIFFVILMVMPGWAVFFYYFHPVLLDPTLGPLLLLVVFTVVALQTGMEKRKTGSSVVPAHVHVIMFGMPLLLYTMTQAKTVFEVAALAGLLGAFAFLLARGQILMTLRGGFGLLLGLGLVLGLSFLQRWVALAMLMALLGLWFWRGRPWLWFPLRLWLVIGILTLGAWGLSLAPNLDWLISSFFILLTLAILLWPWPFKRQPPPNLK